MSTSVGQTQAFTGSSVSYDAGKTWAHIDQAGSKAACRFYDATTSYTGGLHVTGHPTFGSRGIFKSQIVFKCHHRRMLLYLLTLPNSPCVSRQEPSLHMGNGLSNPCQEYDHCSFTQCLCRYRRCCKYTYLDGKLLQSTKLSGATSMRLDVSSLPSGVYSLRLATKTQMISKVITIAK